MKWTTRLFVKETDHAVVVYLTDFKPTTAQLAEWVIERRQNTGQEVVDFNIKQTN